MYLPVPPQPDCLSAWREALRAVDSQPGHSAHNVVVDISNPTIETTRANPGIAIVDDFLTSHGKSLETVANTIFPAALYRRYSSPGFFKIFSEKVLPKVCRNKRWSGYYFERMMQTPGLSDATTNQLLNIVERIRNPKVSALNKFELSLFDPARDVDNSPYGGQCLSFLSFKIIPGQKRRIALTAIYRNHFYIEKLLGNLIGLGRLLEFVALETDLELGSLTVLSTHAEVDLPNSTTRSELLTMIKKFDQAGCSVSANGSSSESEPSLEACKP